MSKLNFEVSPAIAGLYDVVNTHTPTLQSRIGLIDFRTIQVEQAEALVKAGTRYLIKIEKPAVSKKAAEKEATKK